jgi:short subunit fatty acids transporter
VLRRLSALLIAGVVSAFAVLLLTGQYVNEGPVLVRLSQTHGVHVGDLFVVLGWAAALLAVGGLLWSAGRQDS